MAPLVIRGGTLHGIGYTMPVASAQVKSAIILAGLSADGDTVLRQPARSRDHTERMVRAMGGEIEEEGLDLRMRPGKLSANRRPGAGGPQCRRFLDSGRVCHPRAKIRMRSVGGQSDPGRNPGSPGVYGRADHLGGGPSGGRRARRRPDHRVLHLHGTEIGGELITRIIDELPVLAVAACFAEGTTIIRDARELRVKESDRILTTVKELSRLGGKDRGDARWHGHPRNGPSHRGSVREPRRPPPRYGAGGGRVAVGGRNDRGWRR